MIYTAFYDSPLGDILLAADEKGLMGLWFCGQKYFADGLLGEQTNKITPAVFEAMRWLDIYFSGEEPNFVPPLHLTGSKFRLDVWAELLKIPYGQTISYGEIARRVASKNGLEKTSARAVGGAVGHNKISIIVPCHRVVGANGSLTGYAGGIDRKIKLLEFEKKNITRLDTF